MRRQVLTFTLTATFPNLSEMEAAKAALAGFDCVVADRKETPVEAAVMSVGAFARLDEHITDREKEVLLMLAKGFSYSETSEFLGCSVSTVQTHVKRLYRKLGVNSKSEAVFEALQHGIIEL